MRRVLGWGVFCLVFSACVSVASADLTATVRLYDSYGSGPGGEFAAQYSNFAFSPTTLAGGSIETFCLEKNEYIQYGQTYYVDFNDKAVNGGAGGPHPDPLDTRTAFLYSQFINHNLAGYAYNGTTAARTASANALQNTIWYLENEIGSLSQGLNGTEITLAGQFLATANSSTWQDIGNIRVMNLYQYSNGTGHAQDQLVAVPVPGAALLGLIGMGATRWFRRRLG